MARVMREMATAKIIKQARVLKKLFKYGHRAYATNILRPVCALGKDDRHRSEAIFAMVINSPGLSEQNGLGRFTENFNAAKAKPNKA
ncbi:MAG: hypothetical protein Tsb006_1780 [Rickettsiaceae bacterium]